MNGKKNTKIMKHWKKVSSISERKKKIWIKKAQFGKNPELKKKDGKIIKTFRKFELATKK